MLTFQVRGKLYFSPDAEVSYTPPLHLIGERTLASGAMAVAACMGIQGCCAVALSVRVH